MVWLEDSLPCSPATGLLSYSPVLNNKNSTTSTFHQHRMNWLPPASVLCGAAEAGHSVRALPLPQQQLCS